MGFIAPWVKFVQIFGVLILVSKTDFRYFITFVDDHSRITLLYLMKSRSNLFSFFCAEIKTQLIFVCAFSIVTMLKNTFQLPFNLLHQSSCVDTPSQNGVAERKNRHLFEVAWHFFFFKWEFPNSFRLTLSSLPFFLSIGCLFLFLMVIFLILFFFYPRHYSLLNLGFFVVPVLFVLKLPN